MKEEEDVKSFTSDLRLLASIWNELSSEMKDFICKAFGGHSRKSEVENNIKNFIEQGKIIEEANKEIDRLLKSIDNK